MTDLLTRLSGATASREGLIERVRSTTEQMAHRCSVDMNLWDKHSNAALQAADALTEALALCREAAGEIERLRDIEGSWGRFQKALKENSATKRLAGELAKIEAERDAALARVAAFVETIQPLNDLRIYEADADRSGIAVQIGAIRKLIALTKDNPND